MEMKTPSDGENSQRTSTAKKVFQVLGPLFIFAGMALFITGMVSLINSEGELFPMVMVGPFLFFFGGTFTAIGFRKGTTTVHGGRPITVVRPSEQEHSLNPSSTLRDSKKCPYCGAEVESFAQYCDHCGKALFLACPKCHKKNDVDAQYCKYCGEKLSK